MLTNSEIVQVTAQTQQLIKKHKYQSTQYQSMKNFQLEKRKETTDYVQSKKLDDAIFEINESIQNHDRYLLELNHKLTEMGFGLIFQTAMTMEEHFSNFN